MARRDEKTSADRAKMLSRGDTGDTLAEVDKVLGCLVVQTVEHHEAKYNWTCYFKIQVTRLHDAQKRNVM